jgi:hypothetical protein
MWVANAWEAWFQRKPAWMFLLLFIAFSLLFWLSTVVLIWLSSPPQVELPAG